MVLWQNIIEQIKLNFFEYISDGHAFLINNVLQSFFFMMAIIKIITWILYKLNLFFARDFNRSNFLIQVLIFFLFLYLKVWNAYSAHLQILGYFCSVSVCIHLNEGCVRLGRHFCQRYSKNSFGNITSLISIILIFLSYKVFTLSQVEQKENKYSYVALYFLVFAFILIIGSLKKKQLIYAWIIMTTMALMIMLREWSIKLLKDTFLCKVNLPLESLVYLLFAVQQNYKEKQEEAQRMRLNGQHMGNNQRVRPSDIFLAQVYYFIFFLINKRMYNIEIVFAAVCALNYLGTSKFR